MKNFLRFDIVGCSCSLFFGGGMFANQNYHLYLEEPGKERVNCGSVHRDATNRLEVEVVLAPETLLNFQESNCGSIKLVGYPSRVQDLGL